MQLMDLRPHETYLFETVLRDTLSFLITGPFVAFSLVLCVPWINNRLKDKGRAFLIFVVILFSVFQVLGVWGSMFAVFISTTDSFP